MDDSILFRCVSERTLTLDVIYVHITSLTLDVIYYVIVINIDVRGIVKIQKKRAKLVEMFK